MRLLLKLGAGVVARFIGLLAEHFAQWLFHEVSEGAEAAADSLSEFWEFGKWFVRTLAGQLGGSRSRYHFDRYEEDYQPGFYSGR